MKFDRLFGRDLKKKQILYTFVIARSHRMGNPDGVGREITLEICQQTRFGSSGRKTKNCVQQDLT